MDQNVTRRPTPKDAASLPMLACPVCREVLRKPYTAPCGGCGTQHPSAGGVVSFVGDAVTALDALDYDAVYQVDAEASHHLVSNCLALLDGRLPARIDSYMEIGAGTGLFTLGFLDQVAVRSALITDISPNMLAVCRRRLEEHAIPRKVELSYAAWEGSVDCFPTHAFDMVAGFSVLHHVLDYPKMIATIHGAVAQGGVALFFEPNYRFHCAMMDLVSEILTSLAECDPAWTELDRGKLQAWVYENNLNLRFRGDEWMLAGREDKHIFDGAELREAGLAAGFTSVELVPAGNRDESYSAFTVYASQLGLTEPARADLLVRYVRQLPGPFMHLAEEDRGPSFLILFVNGTDADPRPSIGSLPDYHPHGAGTEFLHELTLSLSLDTPSGDGALLANGWILGDTDVNFIIVRCGGDQWRFPVVHPRMDVNQTINQRRIYPIRRALFCGVAHSHVLEGAGDREHAFTIHAATAGGHEFDLGACTLSEGQPKAVFKQLA